MTNRMFFIPVGVCFVFSFISTIAIGQEVCLPPIMDMRDRDYEVDEIIVLQRAWSQALGMKPIIETSIGADLVLIPPGRFVMGTASGTPGSKDGGFDGVEYEVPAVIERPFWIGQCEITQWQWLRFCNSEPWKKDQMAKVFPNGLVGDDLPAFNVHDVEEEPEAALKQFCELLTKTESSAGRIPPNYHFRLAFEAEWEFACRAGRRSSTYFADDEEPADCAWYNANVEFSEGAYWPQKVGSKSPNAFGLFDMFGNVEEACLHVLAPRSMPFPYSIPLIVRGGSFRSELRGLRPGARTWASRYLGFRIVLAPADGDSPWQRMGQCHDSL